MSICPSPVVADVQPTRSGVRLDPTLERILDEARWTPSGDNAQPWRFELRGTDEIVVHLNYENLSVYEYRDGEPIRLSAGMLLESLRIAASANGRLISWQSEGGDRHPRITVHFTPSSDVDSDPLFSCLRARTVNRWSYKDRPLRSEERNALDAALGDKLQVTWYEAAEQRREFARLAAQSTAIRLSTPEAFPTHQGIIDWNLKLSPTKIPSGALGLDRPTLFFMGLGMKSWPLSRLMNRLGGTMMAARQMDHIPINASSAVFAVRLGQTALPPEQRARAVLHAGQQIQRVWLTATRLGLAMQPALAPLIFADYGERQERFTRDRGAYRDAEKLAVAFRSFFRESTSEFVFMGRIGEPRVAQLDCRSVRRPLTELLVPG